MLVVIILGAFTLVCTLVYILARPYRRRQYTPTVEGTDADRLLVSLRKTMTVEQINELTAYAKRELDSLGKPKTKREKGKTVWQRLAKDDD